MSILSKYLWLLKQLQKKDMTFEEINEQWLWEHRNTKDKNIPLLKRTFHNHINAIRNEYGIHIICGSGYKYHIDGPDYEVAPKVERLSILNMMNETVSVNRSLFVEDDFQIFRDPDVVTIMDAIKAKHKVRIAFDSIHLPDERFHELTVAPYQLHYISATWYLLGEADEYGLMRIPLFFTMGSAQITKASYKLPRNYTSEEYGKIIYGTTHKRIHVVVSIHDLHPERLNLEKYPLMPFQQEVSCIDANSIRVDIELPKTPFALHILESRLGHYTYTLLNSKDPFALFAEQQYEVETYYPILLSAKG